MSKSEQSLRCSASCAEQVLHRPQRPYFTKNRKARFNKEYNGAQVPSSSSPVRSSMCGLLHDSSCEGQSRKVNTALIHTMSSIGWGALSADLFEHGSASIMTCMLARAVLIEVNRNKMLHWYQTWLYSTCMPRGRDDGGGGEGFGAKNRERTVCCACENDTDLG